MIDNQTSHSNTIPTNMNAMTLRAFGGTEGFELTEVSVPELR